MHTPNSSVPVYMHMCTCVCESQGSNALVNIFGSQTPCFLKNYFKCILLTIFYIYKAYLLIFCIYLYLV